MLMDDYGEPFEEHGIPVRAQKTMANLEYYQGRRQTHAQIVEEYQENQQVLERILEPEEVLTNWRARNNAVMDEVHEEESVYENPGVDPVEAEAPAHPPRVRPPAENRGQPTPRIRPQPMQKTRTPEGSPATTPRASTQPAEVPKAENPKSTQKDEQMYGFFQQFLDMDQRFVTLDDFTRFTDMMYDSTHQMRENAERTEQASPHRSTVDNTTREQASSSHQHQREPEQKRSTSEKNGVNPAPTSSKTSPTTTSTRVRDGKKCGEICEDGKKCKTPKNATIQPRIPTAPNPFTDTPGLIPGQKVEWQASTEWSDWKGNGKWSGSTGKWPQQQTQAENVQAWRKETVQNSLGAWTFSKDSSMGMAAELSTFVLVDRTVSEEGDGYAYTPYYLQHGKSVTEFSTRGEYLMYMAYFYAFMVKQVTIKYEDLPTVVEADDIHGQYRKVIEAWAVVKDYRFKIRYDYVSENQVMDFTLEEVIWRSTPPTNEEELKVLRAERILSEYINNFQKRRMVGVGTCFDFLRTNTVYGKQLGLVPLFASMQGEIDITTASVFPHVRVCVTNIHLWDFSRRLYYSFKQDEKQFPTRIVSKEWLHKQRVFTRRCNTLGNGDSYHNIPILSYWTEGYAVQEKEKSVLDSMRNRIAQGWEEAETNHREQRPMVRAPNGGIY